MAKEAKATATAVAVEEVPAEVRKAQAVASELVRSAGMEMALERGMADA